MSMYTYEFKLQSVANKYTERALQERRDMIEKRIKYLCNECNKTGLYNLVQRYYGQKLHGTGAQVVGLVNAIIDAEYFGALRDINLS